MISEKEVLAGLKFLEVHAPAPMQQAMHMAISACEAIVAMKTLDDVRARPYDDLELSVATLAALGHIGMKTIRDVEEFAALPDHVILERGKKVYFRKKGLKEVRAVLANIGLGRRNASS